MAGNGQTNEHAYLCLFVLVFLFCCAVHLQMAIRQKTSEAVGKRRSMGLENFAGLGHSGNANTLECSQHQQVIVARNYQCGFGRQSTGQHGAIVDIT
jgi:hypothetical protein